MSEDSNTTKQTPILVVEDSPSLNELIVGSLRKHGYTAKGIFNGLEAIDYIANSSDLIVVLDHILPDITGQAVMKALEEKGVKVPIIIITGNGNEKLAVDLIKQGASDYLVKDSQLVELLPSVIERVCKSFTSEKKLQQAQKELVQKNRDNEFLTNLSFQLANFNGKDIINDVALPIINSYTKASYAHISQYNAKERCLRIQHIEADGKIINKINAIVENKILSSNFPVSEESYNLIINSGIKFSDSIHDLSFGVVPEILSLSLKKVTGFGQFCAVPLIYSGKLYGKALLAFRKNQELPSVDSLRAFANILAIYLRNSLTETSLRKSERMFRRLTENASDIIWTMDFNFNTQYVSPSVYNILGFYPREYLKLTMNQKHPESSIDQFKLILQEELEKEHSDSDKKRNLSIEIEHYNAKGEALWLGLQLSFLRDSDDKPIGIHGISRDITKRKRAEKTLRESETLLSQTQKIAHIGSWNLDLSTNHLKWSDETFRIFGCQPQAFTATYETFLDFVHPDDRAAVNEAYSRSLLEGTDSYEIEHRIVRQHTGEIRYVHERFVHVRDDTDKIIQSTGMVHDITLQKQAEKKLSHERERLANIIQGTNAATWEWNIQTGETYFNERWAEIIGYSLDEISPTSIETWIKFTHPHDLKISGQLLEEHLAGELDFYAVECRMKHKLGHWVWVLDHGKVFSRTEDGKPLMMRGTHQDISKRKQTEEKLNKSEKTISNILENIPQAVLAHDMEGNFMYVNNRSTDYTQYSKEELLRMNVADINSNTFTKNYTENIWKQICKTGDQQVLTEHIRKDGSKYPAEIFVTAINIEEKPVMLAIVQDISQRVRDEQALKESENSLRLSNSQKDLFFQILAHDLKNPIGAMYNISELLRQKHNVFSNEKRQIFIDQLYNISFNTCSLLDELLLWGKSQAGKLPFQPKKIQFEAYISELLETLQPLANNKGITIDFSIPENTEVLADKDMLNVILRNLVTNAIKFTDKGGHIQIISAIDPNQATITVADNGVGMDWETIDSLFKPDKKTTKPGTNNELGTGFGLKLCLEFVEKHGGKIWAESEVGKGSEFKFLLPKTQALAHQNIRPT